MDDKNTERRDQGASGSALKIANTDLPNIASMRFAITVLPPPM
jgi:hypothetical protein